ncbi:hypothetical protein BD408DRAFT_326377, partial [Parasitella parasitica]
DDGNESDYSLDYEFPGPRFANYRSVHDVSDDASMLSDTESDQSSPRFDMWDDDPYNDYTWESNDMQLTKFIKQRQQQLKRENMDNASFWKQEKGWPKQLPFSCSSSNHDQSANAICLVQSNYGLSEYLYAVYRDRIIECGKPPATCRSAKSAAAFKNSNHTTLLESNSHQQINSTCNAADKFMDTHQSISLSTIPLQQYDEMLDQAPPHQQQDVGTFSSENLISQFKPYTKFLKRSDYHSTLPEDSYLYLGFDPQCLAQKYGYMAIGGVEGEFELMIFMIDVYYCASTGEITFGAPSEIEIPPTLFPEDDTPYSSQYVAWSPSSRYFAHTSDSHNLVLVWRASTREILYAVDAAGYTYAICFHPQLDNILVFTNRYGYFHTVDFARGTTETSSKVINILSFDRQTNTTRGHQCVDSCVSQSHHAIFHTRHLKVQHEITMVSFRGEIDKRLRILAKINGIEWSKDGRYLYVATKKRVLAFQFLPTQPSTPTLIDFSGIHIRKSLEKQQELRLGRKTTLDQEDVERLDRWNLLPDHIRNRMLGDTQLLACH